MPIENGTTEKVEIQRNYTTADRTCERNDFVFFIADFELAVSFLNVTSVKL